MEFIAINASYARVANPIITRDWPPWIANMFTNGRLSIGRLANGRPANSC
jgi:hypothetical protein